MDAAGTEHAGGSILVEDGRIAVGGLRPPPDADAADGAERASTAAAACATPGLVNTHHHLYQWADPRLGRRTRPCSSG